MSIISLKNSPVKLRSIALPAEHGGWGLLLEPMLLGLIVAISPSGIFLAFAALCVFLARTPVKIAIKDYRKNRRTFRTEWAERFAGVYLLFGFASFFFVVMNNSWHFAMPLAIAVPLVALQLYFDLQNRSRHAVAEMSGALAIASIAPAIAILGGWTFAESITLWILLGIRSISAIYYVRIRLRLEKAKEPQVYPVRLLHTLGLIVAISIAFVSNAPSIAIIAYGVLTMRAFWGTSRFRRPTKAIEIGISEMIFGFGYAISIGIGYLAA